MRRLVGLALHDAGHQVTPVATPTAAVAQVRRACYDVIVLDLDPLPDVAWPLADQIRRLQPLAYLIVSSATRRRQADCIAGLERGADAYLPKPFPPEELVIRVAAMLRRSRPAIGPAAPAPDHTQPLRIADLIIDPARHDVRVDDPVQGKLRIDLDRAEFATLLMLARHVGQVLPQHTLVDLALDSSLDAAAVYTRIYRLRKKLPQRPNVPRIETVHRCGYRLTIN